MILEAWLGFGAGWSYEQEYNTRDRMRTHQKRFVKNSTIIGKKRKKGIPC